MLKINKKEENPIIVNSKYNPFPFSHVSALTPTNPKKAVATLPEKFNKPLAFPLTKVE